MMRHLLSSLALAIGLAAPLQAQTRPPAQSPVPISAQSQTEVARAALIPGWRQADGSHVAGLLLDLAPGWKTYWRSPGDAGIPPRFDWAGSHNIASLRTVWPTPEAMDQNGMTSIGYPGDVVIPLVIRPEAADRALQLTGRMELGVCKEVCVPATVQFSATLTPDGQRDPRLVAALMNQPLSARAAQVGRVTCRLAPISGGLSVTAVIEMPSAGGKEFVVVETANPAIWVAEAETRRKGPVLTATAEMQHVEGAPFALDRSGLRFTVLGRDHAVDIRGCAAG